MSILEYNGGSVIAMIGKGCIAIGSDKRLGSNQLQTVTMNFEKVYPITDRTYLACTGFATDVQTLHRTLRFHKNLFALREERDMKQGTVAKFVSNMLYKRRFGPWFVDPVVAGLDENDQPKITVFDLLGTPEECDQFAAVGTAQEQLMGTCEALWRPDMNADELFETCSQCLMSAIDRDCFSGWGAVIHVITPSEIVTRHIKTRMD